MGTRHPALASSISNSFPNPDILSLYLFPLTSSNRAISDLNLDWHLPNIVQITQLCELYFSWGNPSAILSKFETGVFSAIMMAVIRDEVAQQVGAQENHILAIHEACTLFPTMY